jgi:hypothetical protein
MKLNEEKKEKHMQFRRSWKPRAGKNAVVRCSSQICVWKTKKIIVDFDTLNSAPVSFV